MKNNIFKALDNLNTKDILSFILFVIYRMKDIPEYSVLSELVYLLDNESFKKFITYFGGQTFKIPSLKEINVVLNALLFYTQLVETNKSSEEILKELNVSNSDKDSILNILNKIEPIIQEYDFTRGKDESK